MTSYRQRLTLVAVPKNASVWERPEPALRSAPAPLNREMIVRTAVAAADAEGLAAVSVRRIAAALGAGPMRLYGYFTTKEELVDLMVDAVHAEIDTVASKAGTPAERMTYVARALRDAALRHGWIADLLGGRPNQGPHALAYLEALLAAVASASPDAPIDAVLRGSKMLQAYVVGAIRVEARERAEHGDSGMTKAEWQEATGPYLQRMLATGNFPHIARVTESATHPSPHEEFETGLAVVVEAIRTWIERAAREGTR